MFTTEFRDMIKDKIDNQELNYLGCGIAREVYSLDENYVVKIETGYEMCGHSKRKTIESLLEQIENDYIMDEEFLDFTYVFDLPYNLETIELFLSTQGIEQSLNEFIGWEKIKCNELLKSYVAEVFDIFIHNDKVIIIQEKGTVITSRHLNYDVTEEALKNFNLIELRSAMQKISSDFGREGMNINDVHLGNFIISKEGKLKLCDLGYNYF